jgi:ABC-type transport system substrate-binding protein
MQPVPMNELAKAQLEAVGFKVDFDTIDWNTMITVFIQGVAKYPQYDAFNFSSGATDPVTFMKGFMTMYKAPFGSNWGGYSNPEVDALAQQVLASFDVNQQNKLLTQIHETIVKDAARVFIVSDLNPRALSPKLSDFVQAQSWFQDITPIVVAP